MSLLEKADKEAIHESLLIENLTEFVRTTLEKKIKIRTENISMIMNRTSDFQRQIDVIAKGLKTVFLY